MRRALVAFGFGLIAVIGFILLMAVLVVLSGQGRHP